MFSSKIIKVILYVFLSISVIISLSLIIFGITSEGLNRILGIIIGIVFPFVALIFVYPLLALANIDENLTTLKEKVDFLIKHNNNQDNLDYNASNVVGNITVNNQDEQSLNIEINEKNDSDNTINGEIDFINKKYGLDISENDSALAAKLQILSIVSSEPTVKIFQEKVLNAKNMQEILNAIRIHKAVTLK